MIKENICLVCSNLYSFDNRFYKHRERKFCSICCANDYKKLIIKEKHWNWKGDRGIYKKQRNETRRIQRLRHGITKRSYGENTNRSKTAEYNRAKVKAYKYRLKGAGILTIKIIQSIYEFNIKKYGTLTCYLCLKPISFGKDSLEHKIPLSRGGDNKINNLDISCIQCNKKKYTKTNIEYLQGIK